MTRRVLFRLHGWVIGLTLASVAGCATTSKEKMTQLQDSVLGYNEAYRWQNYEQAASYVPADLRAAFLATYDDAENALHIEDYQILKIDSDQDDAATVTIRVRFTQLPSVNVEKKTLVQHWHKLEGHWILESEENSLREIASGAGDDHKKDGKAPAKKEPEKKPARADAPGEFGGSAEGAEPGDDEPAEDRGS